MTFVVLHSTQLCFPSLHPYSIKSAGEPFRSYSIAAPYVNDGFGPLSKCTSFLAELVDIGFLLISPNFPSYWGDTIASLSTTTCPSPVPVSLSFQVSDMGGIWIIYAIFIVVGCLVQIISLIRHRYFGPLPQTWDVGVSVKQRASVVGGAVGSSISQRASMVGGVVRGSNSQRTLEVGDTRGSGDNVYNG